MTGPKGGSTNSVTPFQAQMVRARGVGRRCSHRLAALGGGRRRPRRNPRLRSRIETGATTTGDDKGRGYAKHQAAFKKIY